MKFWTGIALFAWVLPALAESRPVPPELPPTPAARAWIEQDPAVQEARAALIAAGHGANMLAAGSYEWATRLTMQRRSYDTGGPNSKEWNAQLERPIRINGKAELDRQLGEVEKQAAQARVGEAIHEAARSLLDLWVDGLSATQTQQLFQEQLSFARQNLKAVESRKRAGDASSLDVSVATADAADVERQANAAASTLAKARATLRVRFPGAQLPAQALGEPNASLEPEAQWLQRVLDASDPLKVAQGALQKAELTASRASADRVPDPTVGVFAASESFRQERIVGVSVSIPLSGTYRHERMRQALQEVESARAAVDRQRRDLETSVAQTYADATSGMERWRIAQQGALATSESARLTQRAYSLGEADLQALLLARRQFLDASRAALEARAEALRAQYRLLVDSHLIWDLALD
ncbi:TolC family protein [Variovorax paradoxus]|jgi:cobalt-zinc-cadmium efflux system outer membrane protein|uniref:TolC family protein n=1 Tax=Variovorax paradoxus TaxID=34073 RepID=UPI001ABC0360